MRLIEIDVGGGDAELVADRCWQAGAAGIWEVGSTLRVGVEAEAAGALVAALGDLAPVDVTEREAVSLPQRAATIGPEDDPIRLVIPPTVFGDGQHPTTAGCLALLDDLVGPGTTVLDVGCGAGALSVHAARRGASVTAVDLDPQAVATTAANAAANGAHVEASTTALGDLAGRFDVVVANISAATITSHADDLRGHTRSGGRLVLSGLLVEQSPAVEDAVGWPVGRRLSDGGWATLELHAP